MGGRSRSCSRSGLLGFVHEKRWKWVGQNGFGGWRSLSGGILQSGSPSRGGGNWVEAKRCGGTGGRICLCVC